MSASRPHTDKPALNRTDDVRTVNVQEAKTHLSALLARVASGERILLARNGKPCAQLIPLDPEPRRQLGFMRGSVDESFFDPLPEDELQSWGV
ncbi:MAG: type II toxin-antitoxin system prevent-host-death family antitoxin [Prochlorococcaceae cyanobacterium]